MIFAGLMFPLHIFPAPTQAIEKFMFGDHENDKIAHFCSTQRKEENDETFPLIIKRREFQRGFRGRLGGEF